MKTFKKHNTPKLLKWFFWFTVASFVIGMVMKIVLVSHIAVEYIDFQNLPADVQKDFADSESAMFVGLSTQGFIILLTLAIYPISMRALWKTLTNEDRTWNRKLEKKTIIEYSTFLALFITFDAYAVWVIIDLGANMDPWLIYTFTSLFIPTIFAIGSMGFVYALRKEKVELPLFKDIME